MKRIIMTFILVALMAVPASAAYYDFTGSLPTPTSSDWWDGWDLAVSGSFDTDPGDPYFNIETDGPSYNSDWDTMGFGQVGDTYAYAFTGDPNGYNSTFTVTDTGGGSFTLTLLTWLGDAVTIDIDATPGVPTSATPLPAAAWLLGTGLLGLVGLRKRFTS